MGGREQNSPIYISRIIPGGVADRYVATQGSKNAKSGCLGHEDLFLCADWVLNILTSFLWPIRVQTRENKLLMSIC